MDIDINFSEHFMVSKGFAQVLNRNNYIIHNISLLIIHIFNSQSIIVFALHLLFYKDEQLIEYET